MFEDLAQLSGRVYYSASNNRIPVPVGWAELGWLRDEQRTGFSAGWYKKGNDIVIAYTGTNEAKLRDAYFGWGPALDLPSAQVIQAMAVYFSVKNAFPSANIIFTGHSLGGGLASLMAVFFNKSATVFDAAPFQAAAEGASLLAYSPNFIYETLGASDLEYTEYYYSEGASFLAREANVVSVSVEGEILQSVRDHILDAIAGSSIVLGVGAQTVLNGGVSDQVKGRILLHSMALLASMLESDAFKNVLPKIPELVSLVHDSALYGSGSDPQTQDFLVKLYISQVSNAAAPLLDRFAGELAKIAEIPGGTARAWFREALVVAALDYFYLKNSVEAIAFLTSANNAVHLSFNEFDFPIERLKSPSYLAAVTESLLSAEERRLVNGELLMKTSWHIHAGTEGMNWGGSGDIDDAVVGGVYVDIIDAGAGDDVIVGGLFADFLTGGAGNDTIIGGGDGAVDYIDGGAGNDFLIGGGGSDVYNFSEAFGQDLIVDSDGQGRVIVNGDALTGGQSIGGGIWQDESGWRYIRAGNNLVIGRVDSTNLIQISNWSTSRSLGITLSDAPSSPPPPPPPPDPLIPPTPPVPDDVDRDYRNIHNPPLRDPLAIDLDGDGIETVGIPAAGSPVLFDHDADGVKTGSGWVVSDDAWLVLDHNGNGLIDSGRELFGVDTQIQVVAPVMQADGTIIEQLVTRNARTGFEALRALDTGDGTAGSAGYDDGLFDANDSAFAQVRLWRDLDQDGVSDAGELQSLTDAGISAIELAESSEFVNLNNGNTITGKAVVHKVDGEETELDSIDLSAGNLNLANNPFYREFPDTIPLSAVAERLPDMGGSGWLRDLREAMSLGSDSAQALTEQVEQFAYKRTQAEQLDELDQLIERWAGTSERLDVQGWLRPVQGVVLSESGSMRSVRYTAMNPEDYPNQHGAAVPAATLILVEGNAAYYDTTMVDGVSTKTLNAQGREVFRRLGVLETFNGARFVDFTVTESALPLSGEGWQTRWSINLTNPQVAEINNAYMTLRAGVYRSLVVQTRLKPYLDAIALEIGEASYEYDVQRLIARLDQAKARDIRNAILDLSDLVRYAVDALQAVGLNGMAMLQAWAVELAADTGAAGDWAATRVFNSEVNQGSNADDVYLGGIDGDVFIGHNGVDLIYGAAGNDSLSGGFGQDVLWGEQGSDKLEGGEGNDTLSGGQGNDDILGGTGDDVIVFGRGDGVDLVTDWGTSHQGEVNVLRFKEGILPTDILVTRPTGFYEQDRLELSIAGASDKLTLLGFFQGTQANGAYNPVQEVHFTDGTVWNVQTMLGKLLEGTSQDDHILGTGNGEQIQGGLGNDTINGGGGNDTLRGGLGNDTFTDVEGDNTFDFGLGDGQDKLEGVASGVNTLCLGSGIDPDDIRVRSSAGGLWLEISIAGTTDRITVKDFFLWPAPVTMQYPLDLVQFSDGSAWDMATLLAKRALGTVYDDWIEGGAGSELLTGQEGNDSLYALAGNDTLDAGAGDDYLVGAEGNNTYLFGLGDGQDVIASYYMGDTPRQSILMFKPGVTEADIVVRKSGDFDLEVLIQGTADKVTLKGYFTADGSPVQALLFDDGTVWDDARIAIERLKGTLADDSIQGTSSDDLLDSFDGNDTLMGLAGHDTLRSMVGDDSLDGGAGDDLLVGGVGNDVMVGGGGNNTYLFMRGDGQDTIMGWEDTSPGKLNTINFAPGIAPSQVSARMKADLSLELTIVGTSDRVIVREFFKDHDVGNVSNPLQRIAFVDGTVWSLAYIHQLVMQSTLADDVLFGSSGGDVLDGGLGSDEIYGLAGDDTLRGGDGADTLVADAGHDVMDGGVGRDVMRGGQGNDSYKVDDVLDTVVELAGEGFDTIESSVSYGLNLANEVESLVLTGAVAVSATGNQLDNVLTGNSLGNVLDGGAGVDTMSGGQGDDVYVVDDMFDQVVETEGGGVDTALSSISWGLMSHLENLTLVGTADGYGWGNDLNNVLTGDESNNTLAGQSGADTLIGGGGRDTLLGGGGDDHYILDSADDVPFEQVNEGYDTVTTSGDIDLRGKGEVEVVVMTGTADLHGIGGDGGNLMVGNVGNNVLDGWIGIDTLQGGLGDDVYVIRQQGDLVIEADGEGEDLVQSCLTSYTLADHIENLTLAGSGSFEGIGNYWGNVIVGNELANVLDGRAGADRLAGGAGDDIYHVDHVSDDVVENAGEGHDTIYSSVSFMLKPHVEVLYLTGVEDISAQGNDASNALIGNTGNNLLMGGGGADTLNGGGAGLDVLKGGAGDDIYLIDRSEVLIEEATGEGSDTVIVAQLSEVVLGSNIENLVAIQAIVGMSITGNDSSNAIVGSLLADVIDGLAGNDTLAGGGGVDTLRGGDGDDVYDIDQLDVVVEHAAGGVDEIRSAADSLDLRAFAYIENARLLGGESVSITGDVRANRLIGNDGQNTLDGGEGMDTLIGGLDNDTYLVDDAGDVVVEMDGEGYDKVHASITVHVSVNVEEAELTGFDDIDLYGHDQGGLWVGNGGDNHVHGGQGQDSLFGGHGGQDHLNGGAGNDTYFITSDTTVIHEEVDGGVDQINAIGMSTLVLPDHIENLWVYSNELAIDLTGNDLNNDVLGSDVDDIIRGMGGNDEVHAGSGHDEVFGGAGNDDLYGFDGHDWLWGDEGSDSLRGDAGNDSLVGGTGIDTMNGGAGEDVYFVDHQNDVVIEDAPYDGVDTVWSSISYHLAHGVETLILEGEADLNAWAHDDDADLQGNAGNNHLHGGAGWDTLTGDAGTDTLEGGAGDDIYIMIDGGDVIVEAENGGYDQIWARTSGLVLMGGHVEELHQKVNVLALNGVGNDQINKIFGAGRNDTIRGMGGDDSLTGNGGNDWLEGGAGNDRLIGGAGADRYYFNQGDGYDMISDNDATAGVADKVIFGPDVSVDALWFSQAGNHLDITVLGTSDKVRVLNWYLNQSYTIEQFQAQASNESLSSAQVANLVSAMAAFGPPVDGHVAMTAQDRQAMDAVIAANWA